MQRILLVAALSVIASIISSAQTPRTYQARLSTVPIDIAMHATVAGSGSATAVLSGTKLSITGSFTGLRSPATVARIHAGPKGMRGPAVLDLQVSSGTSGTISGTFDLTPQQVDDLSRSRWYVQLHSEKAPDGNLRGWFLPQEKRR